MDRPKYPGDDYLLMDAVARREPDALAALYDRHGGLVFTLCHQILRDRASAEDVVTDVFWELWDKFGRYDSQRGSPFTYIATLARSRALDSLRARRAPARLAAGTSGEMPVDEQAAAPSPANPLQQMMATERRQQVLDAMDALDPVQRQAIELAYFGGLSHAEVAASLDKPLGSVKTWIRQGLIRLRESLRTAYEGEMNSRDL